MALYSSSVCLFAAVQEERGPRKPTRSKTSHRRSAPSPLLSKFRETSNPNFRTNFVGPFEQFWTPRYPSPLIVDAFKTLSSSQHQIFRPSQLPLTGHCGSASIYSRMLLDSNSAFTPPKPGNKQYCLKQISCL